MLHRWLVYPIWTAKDANYPFRYVREFEKTQYLDQAELDELRWRRLRQMAEHAYNTTPYYRRKWDEMGIKPDDLRTFEDFAQLPLLEKSDIQEHREELISTAVDRKRLIRNQTGGSTGQPLTFFHDPGRMASRLAATIRHNRWAGKEPHSFTGCFWGHPGETSRPMADRWIAWKDRNIERTTYLDTSSLSLDRLGHFDEILRREKPEIYLAYANSIFLFARFLKESGCTGYHRPKSIITSAELLTNDMRNVIEEVFECRVFNRYGCRETSIIASECSEHRGMHINAECLHVEIINRRKDGLENEVGEIVLSDMLNVGMPMLRYRIKDVAEEVSGACACGRTLPRINVVGGRTTDFISTPDGRIVSGASLTIFLVANAPGVAQAQLRQRTRDELTIRVLRGPDFDDSSIEYLLSTARRFLGDRIRLELDFLSEVIPTMPSGKHRFSISDVDPFN